MSKRSKVVLIVAALAVLLALPVLVALVLAHVGRNQPTGEAGRLLSWWAGGPWDEVHEYESYVLSAQSPNGKLSFQVSVASPKCVIFKRGKFVGQWMGDVAYRLYDRDEGKMLWRYEDPTAGAAPYRVFAGDSGSAAVLGSGYFPRYLLKIFQREGLPRAELDILAAIPKGELDDHGVWGMDAGLTGVLDYALWYFVVIDGREFLCARLWWDRRVVVDLEAGGFVRDRYGADFLGKIDEAEKSFAIRTLQRPIDDPQGLIGLRWQRTRAGGSVLAGTNDDFLSDLLVAAHLVRRMRIEEALPLVEARKELLIALRFTSDERDFETRDNNPRDPSWKMPPLW